MNLCINKSQHAPAGLSETEPNPVSQCGIRSESEPGPVKPIRIRTWPGETDQNPNLARRNRSESEPSPAKPIRIRTLEGRNRSESELRKSNPNPGLASGNMYFRTSYHYNKEEVEDGTVAIRYTRTSTNYSDATTKGLGPIKVKRFLPVLHGYELPNPLLRKC